VTKPPKPGFVGFDSTDLGVIRNILAGNDAESAGCFGYRKLCDEANRLAAHTDFWVLMPLFTIYSILVVTGYPLATTEISGEMRSMIGQWRWPDREYWFYWV
jgi:hypothetical protein